MNDSIYRRLMKRDKDPNHFKSISYLKFVGTSL